MNTTEQTFKIFDDNADSMILIVENAGEVIFSAVYDFDDLDALAVDVILLERENDPSSWDSNTLDTTLNTSDCVEVDLDDCEDSQSNCVRYLKKKILINKEILRVNNVQ